VTIQVSCPNPGCRVLFPLEGLLDFGSLPDSGFRQGTTDATLGADCPECRTLLELRWTATWRQAT
jgi:hypothetical protein